MHLTANYEIVTPLVMGGANQQPEFRLVSYVHVLRWWWRFLALGRFGNLEKALLWDAHLFGWHDKEFGRKRVSFRLLELNEERFPSPWTDELELRTWSGINYLTAQGFSDRKSVQATTFSVEARVSNRALGADKSKDWTVAKETLRDAMALIGLLGGLGARSRRGFGSLAISKLVADDENYLNGLPDSVEAYRRQISTHLGTDRYQSLPRYSAYSEHFGCEICASHNNMRELMNDIGWAFQIYRSYGQRDQNKIGSHVHIKKSISTNGRQMSHQISAGQGKKTWYKQEFRDDHDLFYVDPLNEKNFDNRSIFGLPHNYGKVIDTGWDFDDESKYARRASPLLFHFHRLKGGEAVFVASIVEAQFLPVETKLHEEQSSKKEAELHVKSKKKGASGDQRAPVSRAGRGLLNGFIEFLRDEDPTKSGANNGVPYTSFNRENVRVAP